MNDKVTRDGMVQGISQLGASRDRVYNDVAGSIIKTAGDDKAQKKEEKTKDKAEKKEQKFQDKMTKKEAEAAGFFKVAKAMGWNLYQTSDLDGGLGGIWNLEKDAATGEEYIVKQLDQAGDVVRRAKDLK